MNSLLDCGLLERTFGWLFRGFNAGFRRGSDAYGGGVRRVITHRVVTMGIYLVLIAVTCSPAHAGGSYVGDPGGQAAQRAGAFVARADDASALWHNPAGLARLDGSQLVLALNLVAFEQRYARAGAYADIVIFDPARIGSPATYTDPAQPPAGIERVYRKGRQLWPQES